MSEVRALIEQLVDAGVDPITAAEVITRAAIAGAKDAACQVDDAAERRRAADRERKRAERLRKSAEVTENPQMSADIADSEQKEIPPQTPLKKNNNIYTPPIAPPSETRPRGTRLPADWHPEPLPSDFKTKHGLTDEHCAAELEQFRDYWAGAPGQKGVKLDWQATWRVWLRNSKTNRSRGSPVPPRRTAFQTTMTNLAEIFADEPQAENDWNAVRKLSVSR